MRPASQSTPASDFLAENVIIIKFDGVMLAGSAQCDTGSDFAYSLASERGMTPMRSLTATERAMLR